jgi:hypothetical protein
VNASDPAPEELERAVRRIGELPPEEAVPALVLIANRAVIELHRVSRAGASARRGQDDWGKWARLANAVRSGVLQLASIRDAAKGLGLVGTSAAGVNQQGVVDADPQEDNEGELA